MAGVIKENTQHILDYDFEIVCGSAGDDFPTEYEIPKSNTGTLKDQGSVSACVAEVISQLAENWYSKQLNKDCEMSEGFAYGALRSEKSTQKGMFVSEALKYWGIVGTVPKTDFDVFREMPEMANTLKKFPELYELAEKYKIKGYTSLNYADMKKRDMAIKTALTEYKYGLLAVSDTYFKGGSHCILLTGWNDKNDTYKFKNSWGAGYGNNGYSEMPKSELDKCYLPLFEDIKLPFKDVCEDDWYYNDTKNLYFAGLINGVTADTVEPNSYVTRAEMFALLNRYAKKVDKQNDLLSKILEEKYGDKN